MTHPSTLLSVATFLGLVVAYQISDPVDDRVPSPFFSVPERIVTITLPPVREAPRDLASFDHHYD